LASDLYSAIALIFRQIQMTANSSNPPGINHVKRQGFGQFMASVWLPREDSKGFPA